MQTPKVIERIGKRRKRFDGYRVEAEYRWLYGDYMLTFEVYDHDIKDDAGEYPNMNRIRGFAQEVVTWMKSSLDATAGGYLVTWESFIFINTVEHLDELWPNLADIYLLAKLRS